MSKITDFVKAAYEDKENHHLEFEIGFVANHLGQKIALDTGIRSIAGAKKILTAHAVRHSFVQHKGKKSENERGQIGITIADFEFLTDILSNPTNVIKGDLMNRKNNDVLMFSKNIKKSLYCVLMSVSRSNNSTELFFNTMFIKK